MWNPNYFYLGRTNQKNKLHCRNVQIWQRNFFYSILRSFQQKPGRLLVSYSVSHLKGFWSSRFPSSGKDITGLQPYGLGCEGFQGLEHKTATKSGHPHLPRSVALKVTDGLTYIQCPAQHCSLETSWVWEELASRWKEADFEVSHVSTFNRKVLIRDFYKQSFENNICLSNSKQCDSTMHWCLVHLRYLILYITISKGVTQNSITRNILA